MSNRKARPLTAVRVRTEKRLGRLSITLSLVLLMLVVVACDGNDAPSATAIPTPTLASEPNMTPTQPPGEGSTVTPESISTPTATAEPTPSPISTPTATAEPTPSPISTPTATPEPTSSPIPAIASEPTPTPTQTSTVIEAPSVLDRWPFGAARSVAIGSINQSEYAFVGVENGVLILDIAAPATPEIIGSFPTSYSEAALHLEGTLLLVPLEGSIVAYDVGSPTNPHLLSTILVPPLYGNIVMYGDHVFVSAGGVSIVDWSDRTEPRLVGTLGGVYGRLAVWKNYLLVASNTEGLVLFDIIEPGKPKRVTSFSLCSTSGTPSPIAVDVAVVEDTALVAGDCGLSRIDLSDPSQPREVTHIPEYTKQELRVRRVIAQDNTAIVSTSERLARYSYRSTLSVIAIGKNEDLHILGEMEARVFLSMAFAGNHLYATSDSLNVIDISNPAKPSLVTSLSATEPNAVAYDKGRALVVGTGLWVFDVSSPTDIRVMSYTSLPYTGYKITIKNDIAFISTHEGLLTVNVTPDSEPRVVNTWTLWAQFTTW